MTKQGLKAIEEIQVGDQVLAYNDNLKSLNIKMLSKYKQQNMSYSYWNRKIVCTPNQSILTIDGWKNACELTANDKIKTADGFVRVLTIKIEQLKEKIGVYNFNVLDYHTYVVGNELFVVHNACIPSNSKNYTPDEIAHKYSITVNDYHTKVKPNYKVGKTQILC